MLRWSKRCALVALAALCGLVARDWWRYPVVDPQLGYRSGPRVLP